MPSERLAGHRVLLNASSVESAVLDSTYAHDRVSFTIPGAISDPLATAGAHSVAGRGCRPVDGHGQPLQPRCNGKLGPTHLVQRPERFAPVSHRPPERGLRTGC